MVSKLDSFTYEFRDEREIVDGDRNLRIIERTLYNFKTLPPNEMP